MAGQAGLAAVLVVPAVKPRGGGDGEADVQALQDFFNEFWPLLLDPESAAAPAGGVAAPPRNKTGEVPAPQSYRDAEPSGVQPYRDVLDAFFAGGISPELFGGSDFAVPTLMTEWVPDVSLERLTYADRWVPVTGEWEPGSAALLALPWLGLTLNEVWQRRRYEYRL
jgi:hypothetical protein